MVTNVPTSACLYQYLPSQGPRSMFSHQLTNLTPFQCMLVDAKCVTCCCGYKLPPRLVAYNNIHLFSYSSEDQRSDMGLTGLTSGCSPGCISSGDSRGKYTSWPFPAFRGYCIPWLMAPFSMFKSSSVASSKFSLPLSPLPHISLSDSAASLVRALVVTLSLTG